MYEHFGFVEKCDTVPIEFPPQYQPQQPGIESLMIPRPISENPNYSGSNKLLNKVAIITGGDSGIGRAIAIAFAKEGADIVIVYLNEHGDASETKDRVNQLGRQCLTIAGDIGDDGFCHYVVKKTMEAFGHLEILINNAGEAHTQASISDISAKQLQRTFQTNIFSYFYLTQAAMPYLKNRSSIINTASLAAYNGLDPAIDYAASKGAVVAFTRSLALSVINQGIRVNGVAPGPVWTPLIPSSAPPELYATLGSNTPMKRTAQPFELAPAYVYLASDDSSYVTGQILHVNGGVIING
ncbi:SDR family oxidoreductase [Bacillus cereus group sp. BfR-BA-01380]|uniref:SDR family oxidoreductase n=1 Tax=Bacillus cereus group sp. BfR-BA-01380 TaxID=2920324 RepID=UPI001F5833C8|nr:SDR family oxidoreductase [Bacillus cereus group sp. BfR-BA-01380]